MFCIILSWRHNRQRPSRFKILPTSYICIRNMTFSMIKQIVHVVEGNIKIFHPSKNHCQPRLTSRLTMVFSGWKISILPSTTWAIYILSTLNSAIWRSYISIYLLSSSKLILSCIVLHSLLNAPLLHQRSPYMLQWILPLTKIPLKLTRCGCETKIQF
jgi:hypothetical protein